MKRGPYLHSPAWSDACHKGGDGQCDGFIYPPETYFPEECGCPCHTDHRPWGDTVAEVKAAHEDFWRD